ncbi:MAG: hypothetical protein NC300_09775 [Bacteroidales bacterium]|nr:hypothetical protein [Clostridium sp.]MCM1204420.1 hypothetical protein [Bacteroidales bacterium]
MQNLPANVTRGNDTNIISIAASSNKGMLIRFLNEQVEEGFYALVIDYLKDHNFDLSTMLVDDDVKAQCTKLYELAEFVDENIKRPGKYEIEEWIEPLFKFVYGDIDPSDTDAIINTTGIYRYSIWLIYLYQLDMFGEAMRLIGERVAPLLINTCYQITDADDRPATYDKAVMGYMDLINVVMEMDLSPAASNSEAYLNNLEVLYDYFVEDTHVGNDYKIQFSMGMFNSYIRKKEYNKAFEFYGLNAEYIPVDNMRVYENFKELIRNCNSTQYTNVLSRSVISAISKQDIYNKRIDSLLVEVSAFVKKVYKYIEDEPVMKKNLQILGTGSSLTDKSNVFEGLYEYNLVFHECGIKQLVNQDLSTRSWEEKYEILDMLYTTLNVVFDGYNVYEISNRIEHQYVELTWIGNYVNANPSLLKLFFSVKEKIKAFKVRKDTIVEKSKTNYEIKKLLEDRQKHLVFLAADDMIRHGLNNKGISLISSGYSMERAKKMFQDTYNKIVLPSKYEKKKHEPAPTPKFGFGKAAAPAANPELNRMFNNLQVEEMLCKSEWLWNQYIDRGKVSQTEEECTYSIACLVKVVELLIVRKSKNDIPESTPNKRVIITKTGKVIELSDESDNKPVNSGSNDMTVIEHINCIEDYLRDRREENIEYVKSYIEDWIGFLMQNKFDKDSLLSVFDAEDIRTKTLQTIKKLNYDMVAL